MKSPIFVVLPWLGFAASCVAGPLAPLANHSVVAFGGGEDLSAIALDGSLEAVFTAAWPDAEARFRNLAWEGDTVFEQRRDLNFPSWEDQLKRVQATVVFLQFGQAEALESEGRRRSFSTAYETLLAKTKAGHRRVVLLSPTPFEDRPTEEDEPLGRPPLAARNVALRALADETRSLAERNACEYVDLLGPFISAKDFTRDGLHLNAHGLRLAARAIGQAFGLKVPDSPASPWREMAKEIREKNELWFHYWRPQNWAFLAGDRTAQASSRDHRDPKIRWFPTELEEFTRLVAEREAKIHSLAKSPAK